MQEIMIRWRFAVVLYSHYQVAISMRIKIYRYEMILLHRICDYIYEYQSGGYGYTGDTMRRHEPANEILTLADYRMRHSQYKLDPT